MPDPLDTNDDWADLAREFNLDKPAAPPDMVERKIDAELVEPHHGDPRAEDEAEGEPELAAADDDTEDGAPGEAGEPTADGEQPGTGRKRKRRRRRRRKGAPAEGAVSAAALEDAEEGAEAEAAEAEGEEEPVAESAEGDDFEPTDGGDMAEYTEDEAAPLVAEEDTASDVLRELIATWNVPAWDDIIGGLYRPN